MLDQMMRMLEGQQINSYRLNKFLGAGSFGGVFHASEMVRNTSVQEVAIKVIPESSDDKLIELQNARKLEHSNLIKAYSVGEFRFLNTEMLYLAMELAQGSLENHIQKGGLSSSEIKNITAQVAQGLNYLHSQNKVHRDLKPGNILKVNQQYKLADFGLIRTLNNKSHTQTVHNSGTIIYMPPEAFRGDISSAWDLWSLGIMLIEMTTNQLPYKFNNDIHQLMAKVMNCELQIPSLPKDFKPIIEGCLQKDRKQRWTAQQVLNALQPVGWNSPPSPPPAPAAVKKPVSPTPFTEKLPNRVTLEMVSLPAGQFLMGSPDSDPDARDAEKPQHQVKVNSFAIGKYPVTQAQYEAVMGKNPSHFKNNPQNPVERVSCNDAKAFCQKLSQITGKTYRLPTEAEWEYACRAGTTTRYYFGDDANQLGDYAWYKGNSRYKTHPVGEKKPNAWGLYDMSGNVWEWCEDNWHDNYIGAPKDGSAWLTNDNDYKIVRGGSWFNNPDFCRSAYRLNLLRRDYDDSSDGFRVVCGAGRESIATVTSTPLPKESPTPLTNFTEKLPKAVTLEMVSLPAGQFLMGSPDYESEKPQHQVKVNSFAIGKYPVTQAQYEAVMGTNPSHFKNNPQNPVESVSWNDAQAFCKKLSQITGKTYRLPTEAEWEYACRAGTTTRYYFGDDANQLGDYAWYIGNSQQTTHPVGQKKPNAWGLYDMSGNVWEWCEDNWHDNYIGAPTDGSAWLINNDYRSHFKCPRGGSWFDFPGSCRSAFRFRSFRFINFSYHGFRVVCGAGRTL